MLFPDKLPLPKCILQNFKAKQTSLDFVWFKEMPLLPCQFSSCTMTSQAAGGSRCCPLIAHYPLCFKSIVNYFKKRSLLIQLEKWTAWGRQKFVWQKDWVLCRVKSVLPPLLLIGPLLSFSEASIPFCTVPTLHFSRPHHFNFSC